MCQTLSEDPPPRRSRCELLSKLSITAKPIRSNIVNRRKRVPVTIGIPHILHRTLLPVSNSPSEEDRAKFVKKVHSLGNVPCNILPIKTPNPSQRNINSRRNATARPNVPINRPSGMRDPMRTLIDRDNALPSRLVRRGPDA